MTIELSPNSRFAISSNPDVLPGKCAVCGSSGGDDRQFVDFGIQLDGYGAVYFCTYCVTELAEAIGYVRHTSYAKLFDDYVKVSGELAKLSKDFERYQNAARTMVRNCTCGDVLDSEFSDSRYGVFAGEDKSESSEDDSGSDKPGSVEGHSDVLKPARTSKSSRSAKSK